MTEQEFRSFMDAFGSADMPSDATSNCLLHFFLRSNAKLGFLRLQMTTEEADETLLKIAHMALMIADEILSKMTTEEADESLLKIAYMARMIADEILSKIADMALMIEEDEERRARN